MALLRAEHLSAHSWFETSQVLRWSPSMGKHGSVEGESSKGWDRKKEKGIPTIERRYKSIHLKTPQNRTSFVDLLGKQCAYGCVNLYKNKAWIHEQYAQVEMTERIKLPANGYDQCVCRRSILKILDISNIIALLADSGASRRREPLMMLFRHEQFWVWVGANKQLHWLQLIMFFQATCLVCGWIHSFGMVS